MLCYFYNDDMGDREWEKIKAAIQQVCAPLNVELTLIDYRRALIINDGGFVGESFVLSARQSVQASHDMCDPVTPDHRLAVMSAMCIVAHYEPGCRRLCGPADVQQWMPAIKHVRAHTGIPAEPLVEQEVA